MSSRSGITASPEVVDAFNLNKTSAIVVTLSSDATQLVHDDDFLPPKVADSESILELLQLHLKAIYPEPRYVIVDHLSSGERVFVSFVPDDAPVRQKMLFASTKNTFLQQLGSAIANKNILSFTELAEWEYAAFSAALRMPEAEVSLTDKEKSLQVLDSLLSLSMSGLGNQLPSMSTVSSTALFFRIDSALDAVLKLDLRHKLVVMSIDTEKEVLCLHAEESGVSVNDLITAASKLVPLDPVPVYLLYGYTQSHIAFIYSCASGCKVKARMLYAANKQGLLSHLKSDYFSANQLDQVIEVGDLDELELSQFQFVEKQNLEPTTQLKFSKPKGPRRK